MGIGKVGVSIGKEVIAWARTGKSLLTARPIKTNTCGLKYAPDLEKNVVQISKKKPLPEYNSFFIDISHKSEGGLCPLPEYLPKNYVRKTKSGNYEFAPCYKLDKLWAKEKGDGTIGVQNTVLESLEDNETCGRVLLDACCLDGKTAPGAFYYKLGFRFNNPLMNKECEQWIKAGGRYQDAPFCTGYMHLPKENIEHCLKYGNEQYYYNEILPDYEEEIKRALL